MQWPQRTYSGVLPVVAKPEEVGMKELGKERMKMKEEERKKKYDKARKINQSINSSNASFPPEEYSRG